VAVHGLQSTKTRETLLLWLSEQTTLTTLSRRQSLHEEQTSASDEQLKRANIPGPHSSHSSAVFGMTVVVLVMLTLSLLVLSLAVTKLVAESGQLEFGGGEVTVVLLTIASYKNVLPLIKE
jgi:hypothetical protein